MNQIEIGQAIEQMRQLWPGPAKTQLINNEQVNQWWSVFANQKHDVARRALRRIKSGPRGRYFPSEQEVRFAMSSERIESGVPDNRIETRVERMQKVRGAIQTLPRDQLLNHALHICAAELQSGLKYITHRQFKKRVERGEFGNPETTVYGDTLDQMIYERIEHGVWPDHRTVFIYDSTERKSEMVRVKDKFLEDAREIYEKASEISKTVAEPS